VADYNEDHVPDVVGTANGVGASPGTVDDNGELTLLLGKGDGTFAAPRVLTKTSGPDFASYDVFAADVDRDGHLDIIYGGTILFGAGNGTFPRTDSVNATASIVSAGTEGSSTDVFLFSSGFTQPNGTVVPQSLDSIVCN
jgi:hypothetical protein